MKRNSIFMWAYITFIGMCIIARIIRPYSLWQPIVIAITISSTFFAIEDLYSSKFRYLQDSCRIAEEFFTKIRAKSDDETATILEIGTKLEHLKEKSGKISALISKHASIKERFALNRKWIEAFGEGIKKKRKKQVYYHRVACVFAFIGFLLFFCTMVLANYVTVPAAAQEGLTVISFAVILVTQQRNLSFQEKIKNETLSIQEALKARERMDDTLNLYKVKLGHLENLVEEKCSLVET